MPKHTLPSINTAPEIEVVAQTKDIVPSTPAINTGWFSLDSDRNTGTRRIYANANGVMVEQKRSAPMETGVDVAQVSVHQLTTVVVVLVRIA